MYKIKNGILIGIKYITLILGAIVAIIPLVVVFMASFKTKAEFASSNKLDLPESFLNIENYKTAFTGGKMVLGFVNTSIILVVALFGTIIIGTLVAYVLSRFEFKLSKILMILFLFATLIPSVTTQVATFQIVESLGLFNSRLAPIMIYMGTDIISIYIFIQFMGSISVSLDESAMLEGASYFTIYRKIIMPLLKPAIVTVVIIRGITMYNDFYTPFLYMPSADLPVVSTSLFRFVGPFGAQWEIICAGIIITIIPTLIIFFLLQKYIYNGFTQGSVK
ncbi:MAG: carbohydrate ABC transporter permease [Vallitaleaceae bacterium]|jgi:raffinose/stachyose/melibiose transport system permease protein|nr:carbohydrate ABC transporter permease [Vallitaleaceae bacterium]